MRRSFGISGVLLTAVVASCTGGGAGPPSPGPSLVPSPAASPDVPPPIVLDVVAAADASTGAPDVANDLTYLDGMRLAVRDVNTSGGVGGRPLALRFSDDGGDPTRAARLIQGLLEHRPTALLYVGPGEPLTSLRDRITEAGVPVILLQGDLYSGRQLYRQVFQTSIPWEWQSRVLARYLVLDRESKRILFAGVGPNASVDATVARAAVEYWGGSLWGTATAQALGDLGGIVRKARSADAVMLDASPVDSVRAVGAIRAGIVDPPRIAGGSGLLVEKQGSPLVGPEIEDPPPGTTACYTYTWAGWAEPIPRVGDFVERFELALGHAPVGFEQEGYDAVRALALALDVTGGGTGNALVEALEDLSGRYLSGFPLDLGPDDHLFLPRDELGLFAVPGPRERLDPWQHRGGPDWRALMRTFTYDGERDNILDRDRKVFFPSWKKPQPGPEYWKSRYGIVSRPSDPLH